MQSVPYIGEYMHINMIHAVLLLDRLKFFKGGFTQTITINVAIA